MLSYFFIFYFFVAISSSLHSVILGNISQDILTNVMLFLQVSACMLYTKRGLKAHVSGKQHPISVEAWSIIILK